MAATIQGLGITGLSGIAVRLSNADDSTLTNLDLTNPDPTDTNETGVSVESGSDNVVLQSITVAFGLGANGISVSASANPTIQGNSLINNVYNNSGAALYLDSVTGLVAGAVSGNDFSGSGSALRLRNMSGVTIGDTASADIVLLDGASGLGKVGTALYLTNVDGSTIDGLDLSWTGPVARQGNGILADTNSDDLTITNVTADNRANGITITGGTDLILTNNILTNNSRSLYIDSAIDGADGDTAPLTASGNDFTGSAIGMELFNMTGLAIGTSGTDIVIDNAADGLNTTTNYALWVRNLDSSTIRDVDLSWTGASRSGYGIYSDGGIDALTVQNVSADNRVNGFTFVGNGTDLTLINNSLTNNSRSLYVDSFTDGADADTAPFTATGTVMTNSQSGMQLWNMTGLMIGTSGTDIVVDNATDGFTTVVGNVFYLRNLDNSSISGLDLTWSGPSRSGAGIVADSSTDNLAVQNITASNRSNGVQLYGGGKDLTIDTLDVSNDNYGLYLDGFTDGPDADSAPILVSGVTFTNSGNPGDGNSSALTLFNMSNLTLGPDATNNVVIANTDGLKTAPQNAIWLATYRTRRSTAWTSPTPVSAGAGGGIYSDGNWGEPHDPEHGRRQSRQRPQPRQRRHGPDSVQHRRLER